MCVGFEHLLTANFSCKYYNLSPLYVFSKWWHHKEKARKWWVLLFVQKITFWSRIKSIETTYFVKSFVWLRILLQISKWRKITKIFKIQDRSQHTTKFRCKNWLCKCNWDTSRLKVGKNKLVNRMTVVNGLIKHEWMNNSLNSFKIKCKALVLVA